LNQAEVVIVAGEIRLDKFLKWSGAVSTGGQGKILIQTGMVRVNKETIKNRGRILINNDIVSVRDIGDFIVASR
jgi:ribosome-associated protein